MVKEFTFFFLIFAFLGWLLEVAYYTVKTHRFVNRGYNNGPVCPIYGLGIAFIHTVLSFFDQNFFLLIAVAFVLPTVLELLTGFAMNALFHTKWWDYSDMKYNLGGYICLRFSVYWGLLGVFIAVCLFPAADALYGVIPETAMTVAECVLMAIFGVDLLISTLAAVGMGAELKVIGKTAALYRAGSDAVGKGVCNGTAKIEEIYRKFAEKTNVFRRRILDAFPTMKSGKYDIELHGLRDVLEILRVDKKEKKDKPKKED